MGYLNAKQKLIIILFIISYIAFFVISLLIIAYSDSDNNDGNVQGVATGFSIEAFSETRGSFYYTDPSDITIDEPTVVFWSDGVKIAAITAGLSTVMDDQLLIREGKLLLEVTKPYDVLFGNITVEILESGTYYFDYSKLTVYVIRGSIRSYEDSYVTDGQHIDLRIRPGEIYLSDDDFAYADDLMTLIRAF